MKKLLLRLLFLLILCNCLSGIKVHAQENAYSSPDFFYSNVFDNGSLNSFSTYRDGVSGHESIAVSTTSPLKGAASLRSVNRVTPFSNALSASLLTSGTNLADGNIYEIDFLYKYSTSNNTTAADVVDFATGGVASGKGGWRYWIAANNRTPSANGGLGLYFCQTGKTLSFNSKESNGAPRNIITYAIDPDVTYIVKVLIQSNRYRIFIDPYYNYSTTSTQRGGNQNFGGGLNTYTYSVLEMDEKRTSSNFQFDDLKLYRPTISIASNASLNSTAVGISNANVTQGQKNVVALGYSLTSRGLYNLTSLKFSLSSGNFSTYFSSVRVYKSNDNSFSVTADSLLYTLTPPNSGTLTYATSLPVFNATYPSTPTYYFIVFDLNTDFASTGSVSFNLEDVAISYDNYNGGTVSLPTTYDGQTFLANLAYKWVGTNTDWNTNTNWYIDTYRYYSPFGANGTPPTAPPAGSYVLIPTSATSLPTATSDLTLSGLTIQSGKTLTLNNASLTVANELTTEGDLKFTGSTSKSLTLASGVTTSLTNLVIDKGAIGNSLTLTTGNAMLNVTGAITLTNGTLIVNPNTLTLKSSATSTARIAALNTTTSAITGSVTAERYVTGGGGYNGARSNYTYRNYRIMSSPVYNSLNGTDKIYNLQYIPSSSVVTGATGGTVTSGNPTLYLYREDFAGTNATFTSSNFRAVTAITSTSVTADAGTRYVYPGTGFLFYFRGNNSNVSAKTTSPYVAPESVVFSNTGTINQGDITVKNWLNGGTTLAKTTTAVSTAQGLQLVGNPYPSSIDWDLSSGYGGTAGIDPTIYTFNPVTGQYEAYLRGSGGVGASRSDANIIASGQAFFVKITSNGTFIFKEAAKSAAQQISTNLLLGTPVKTNQPVSFARIKLGLDSLNNDNVVLLFKDNADDKYIDGEDGIDLGGSGVLESLSTRSSDDVALAINTLSLPKKSDKVIPLSVDAFKTGLYTLSLNEIQNIPSIYQVWLRDKLKKDSLDMRANKIYTFNLNKADATTYGKDRFEVVIRQNPELAVKLLDFNATKVTTGVQLAWVSENEGNYTNFTVERSTDGGKTFEVTGGFSASNIGKYTLVDKSPVIGLNQYRLKQDDINGDISYSKPVNVMYSKLSDNVTVNVVRVYPNPVSSIANVTFTPKANAKSYKITITNSSGILMTKATITQPEWQANVGNFLPGTYFVQVIDNTTSSVIGNNKFIKL